MSIRDIILNLPDDATIITSWHKPEGGYGGGDTIDAKALKAELRTCRIDPNPKVNAINPENYGGTD